MAEQHDSKWEKRVEDRVRRFRCGGIGLVMDDDEADGASARRTRHPGLRVAALVAVLVLGTLAVASGFLNRRAWNGRGTDKLTFAEAVGIVQDEQMQRVLRVKGLAMVGQCAYYATETLIRARKDSVLAEHVTGHLQSVDRALSSPSRHTSVSPDSLTATTKVVVDAREPVERRLAALRRLARLAREATDVLVLAQGEACLVVEATGHLEWVKSALAKSTRPGGAQPH